MFEIGIASKPTGMNEEVLSLENAAALNFVLPSSLIPYEGSLQITERCVLK